MRYETFINLLEAGHTVCAYCGKVDPVGCKHVRRTHCSISSSIGTKQYTHDNSLHEYVAGPEFLMESEAVLRSLPLFDRIAVDMSKLQMRNDLLLVDIKTFNKLHKVSREELLRIYTEARLDNPNRYNPWHDVKC